MNKILTICPSRGRPDIAKRMFDSFKSTSTLSSIKICLDFDDPKLVEYTSLIPLPHVVIQDRMTTTQIINKAFRDNPDWEFYHVTNDDMFYQTPGWDETFISNADRVGPGIFYGNDTMRKHGELCVAPVISGSIIRALGWAQMPTLTHLYGDNVWMEIGKRLGILYYHHEIIIEHRHWNNKKAVIDDGYRRVNSTEMFRKDDAAFTEWLNNNADSDIGRVKNAIAKKP